MPKQPIVAISSCGIWLTDFLPPPTTHAFPLLFPTSPPSASPTMASAAGRKKSVVSSAGLQIDTPVANNGLLNQAAITSLYQECSRLRQRLLLLRGFGWYFELLTDHYKFRSLEPAADVVNQLWDLFCLGIPLCYIWDLLPEEDGFEKINYSEWDMAKFGDNRDRASKHAIAKFAMQIRSDKVAELIPKRELFTITDLWSREDETSDGFVRVRGYGCLPYAQREAHRFHVA